MSRPEGTPNRPRQKLLMALRERFGAEFDPVVMMADIAVQLHTDAQEEGATHQVKIDAVSSLEKVAKFVSPQLKAVEMEVDVTGEVNQVRTVRLVAVPAEKAVPIDQPKAKIAHKATQEVSGGE